MLCSINSAPSALFHKLRAALGTADYDASFSLGDPDLLTALRTFINMVFDALGRAAVCFAEKRGKTAFEFQKFLVFRVSFRNIAGKSPEIKDKEKDHIDESCRADKEQNSGKCQEAVADPFKQDKDDQNDGKKTRELVGPVSSLHKQRKPVMKIFEHEYSVLQNSNNCLWLITFETHLLYCRILKKECNELPAKKYKK